LNQLAWIHEMLHRHGLRAVLSLKQELTLLLELCKTCCTTNPQEIEVSRVWVFMSAAKNARTKDEDSEGPAIC